MAINEHPLRGTILWCDFNHGFIEPEMVKRRPVIVVSPKIRGRSGLCTVVALSTTAPFPKMPYHAQIDLAQLLPAPLQSKGLWVKGDMVNTVGFHRLNLIRTGKIGDKRQYYFTPITSDQMRLVQKCILSGMGLANLTTHL